MATETGPADQILTTGEQVDKKMSEEVKATDQDSVSLPKRNEGERPKTEDSARPETPCESVGTNDKKIELPVVEAEKTTDVPLAEVPVGVETKVENGSLPDSQAPDIDKKVFDVVESTPEVQSPIESVVVKEAPTTPAIETTEIGEVEQPKIVEAIERPEEQLEVTPEKGSVETVLEEIKDSEPDFSDVKKPELSIAEVEEKLEKQTEEVEKKHDEVVPEERVQDETVKVEESVADKVEQTACLVEGKTETDDTPTLEVEEEPEQPKLTEEEKKPVEVGPEKSVEDETVKDEGSTVYKVEEASLLEEVTTDKDETPSLIPEDALLSREAPIAQLDKGDSSLPDVIEQVNSEDQKKELSEDHGVEKLEEEAVVQNEKVEEENKNSDVITQDSTPPVDEDQKEEVSGVDVVEKEEKGVVELAGEKEVVTEDAGKRNLIIEDSVQPIIEDQKTELGGADGSEKLAEDAMVKEKVGEEIVAKKVENEEDEMRDATTEDSTQPIEENQKKELGGVDFVEKLEEEAAVKLEELGEEKVAKNVEIEENEKTNVITSGSVQPIREEQQKDLSGVDVVEKLAEVETEKLAEHNGTKNVITEVLTEPLKEEVNSSVPSFEVTEKSFEGAGKDIEPAAENEHIKDEIPANVETTKDESVEAIEEPVTDSKQSEAKVKGEEILKTEDNTLEKVSEDVAKSDENVKPAPTKDGNQTKPSEDLPKELPAKPSPKQANTILSKVKQSLVKAKKAITGKSPSSKTPPSGTKEDIKVK